MVDERLQSLVEQYEVRDLLSGHILLVDDDLPNLEVLQAVLESDYVVHQADSGRAALEIVSSLRPEPGHPPTAFLDVIVADQRMPGMTGVELLEAVSREYPDIAGIVLTGYTDSDAIIAAINRAGAFRFLTKPWNPDEIRMAVADAQAYVYQRRAIERLVGLVTQRNEELAKALEALQLAQERMLHMERLSTMGRLTAGLIHDLRNFLMGLALIEEELAMRRQVTEDLRETVSVGLAGMRNLLATLETLNHFARGGPLTINPQPLSPRGLLHDALVVMRGDMEFRRREVQVQIADDLPDVSGDPPRLIQVLVNLLRNAVQATKPGQRIVVEASRDTDGRVVIAVEDEGPGVPPEIRDNLFDPFVSSKGESGMGMGLYMVKLIVEGHGGSVRYETSYSGRTRFVLTFDRAI